MPVSPEVVGFGSVSIDEYVYVDQCLDADKGRIVKRHVDYGGNCATALVTASVLGVSVGYIGWLSSDPDYAHLADHLRASHVDISHACWSPAVKPVLATVLVGKDGERFIAYSDPEITPLVIDKNSMSGARFLHVDSYAFSSLDCVRLARQLGLIIVGDIEWSTDECGDELRNLCHHLIVPAAYAKSIAGTGEPRAMLDALWSETHVAVVVTCGEDGSYIRFGDESEHWHQPAFTVESVDTTGCGDCFHGAYLAGLSMGFDLLHCMRYASAAAAIAASHFGGQAAVAYATSEGVKILFASPDGPIAKRI